MYLQNTLVNFVHSLYYLYVSKELDLEKLSLQCVNVKN